MTAFTICLVKAILHPRMAVPMCPHQSLLFPFTAPKSNVIRFIYGQQTDDNGDVQRLTFLFMYMRYPKRLTKAESSWLGHWALPTYSVPCTTPEWLLRDTLQRLERFQAAMVNRGAFACERDDYIKAFSELRQYLVIPQLLSFSEHQFPYVPDGKKPEDYQRFNVFDESWYSATHAGGVWGKMNSLQPSVEDCLPPTKLFAQSIQARRLIRKNSLKLHFFFLFLIFGT